jgi:hypothetical protein
MAILFRQNDVSVEYMNKKFGKKYRAIEQPFRCPLVQKVSKIQNTPAWN